jgi:hypothetical protein
MTGDEWLATVFQPALTAEPMVPGREYEALRGQLHALRDCEVLTPDAFAAAEQRLDEASEAARSRRRPRVRPAGSEARPGTNRLLRVLAPAEPLADVDSVTFVLTSVELWEHRVELFGAGLRAGPHDPAYLDEWSPDIAGSPLYELLIGLSDDLGTRYDLISSDADGSASEWRLHNSYAPGVPHRAGRLILNIADDDGRPLLGREIPL